MRAWIAIALVAACDVAEPPEALPVPPPRVAIVPRFVPAPRAAPLVEEVAGADDADGEGLDDVPDTDLDSDDIPDTVDRCPDQPDDANGPDDIDGCPEIVRDAVE